MNYEEFAFFNQQLAAMLRDGIPLEGAVKELVAGMRNGPVRTELTQLEADLSRGTPLKEALARRKLPEFYRHMVELGVKSNDLPGVLTLLADHYQRANALWLRLKGIMVYPLIVVIVAALFTALLSVVFHRFLPPLFEQFTLPAATQFLFGTMWLPPGLLVVIATLFIAAIAIPSLRAKLRWRVPAFREASLAQVASAISLMLKNGATLSEALSMAQVLEGDSPAAPALAHWRALVEAGHGKPSSWYRPVPPFPPLFLWLVQKGGENVAAGFQKASEIYQARASYRIEMFMYGLLPVSILLLGQFVFWEIAPLVQGMISVMNNLGN